MSIRSIRLQPDLEQPLAAKAEAMHRSKNWIVNQALREYFDRQDAEARRWQETLEALEAVKVGDVVDGEQVHQWLESWGREDELPTPRQ